MTTLHVSTMVVLSREEVAGGLGVIEASGRGFACEVTLRVRRFVRLQRDLGVNVEGAAVIVDLLDRIEALEHDLAALRRR
jgi:MerR family transcriptional regulator/heat shock protein HspR